MKSIGSIILSVLLATSSYAQDSPSSKLMDEARQNQQRIINLVLLEPSVRELKDARLRCSFRTQIAKFIFEKKIESHFGAASEFILECLDDVEKNLDQFDESEPSFWRSHLISLLRVNLPGTAAKIEEKYLTNSQGKNLLNSQELGQSNGPSEVADRLVADIHRGQITPEIVLLVSTIRQNDQKASSRVLEALLTYFEETTKITDFAVILNALSAYYVNDKEHPKLKKEFLILAIGLGQKALLEQERRLPLTEVSRNILRRYLLDIEEVLPGLYPQALSVVTTLDSKLATENKEKEEAYRRIRDSIDKLRQTIEEAESTRNKALKNEFLRDASNLALQRKTPKLAADLIMKIESDGESFTIWRNGFMKDEVLSAALKEKDFDSAEYVVRQLDIPEVRAVAKLKIAAKYLELKAFQESSQYLDDALAVAAKANSEVSTIDIIFRAMPIAIKLSKLRAFEILNSAVDAANRIPALSTEAENGEEGRKKYVYDILAPVAGGLSEAFETLAKADVNLAETLIAGIRVKEWRLAAQIAVEKQRKFTDESLKIPAK